MVTDNFDVNISFANGIKSTHSLAFLVTHPTKWSDHFAGREQDQAPEKHKNV